MGSMMLDDAELERLHRQVAEALRAAAPAAVPLDPDDADACTLWRACELCCYLDHRVADPGALPDPRGMSAADIDAWSARLLLPGERITDPRDSDWYQSYWLVADGARVGTVALQVWGWGWAGPHLGFASLYVLREHRRRGHARRLLAALYGAVEQVGLAALRLETDWLWQPAVRLYLASGFSVANWKHALSLERRRGEPLPRVRVTPPRMELLLEGDQAPLISATRDGEHVLWQDHRTVAERQDRKTWLRWEPTLALWLAVRGWPMVRSPRTWADRLCWMDTGMPEGLADKIQRWEAYARHHGLPVRTPRIPGLAYPDFTALNGSADGPTADGRQTG
jgi:GNAT superfamily N-acetyltransferase